MRDRGLHHGRGSQQCAAVAAGCGANAGNAGNVSERVFDEANVIVAFALEGLSQPVWSGQVAICWLRIRRSFGPHAHS